jgi:hypothetical protein
MTSLLKTSWSRASIRLVVSFSCIALLQDTEPSRFSRHYQLPLLTSLGSPPAYACDDGRLVLLQSLY